MESDNNKEKRYFQKYFKMSFGEGQDNICLAKKDRQEWCTVEKTTGSLDDGKIEIRGMLMAEQLYFMLGQMLGMNE